MNAAESIIDSRKTNEISLLRDFVERMSCMCCYRVAWFESENPPEDCYCPACSAIECLATIGVMAEVYDDNTGIPTHIDMNQIGQA